MRSLTHHTRLSTIGAALRRQTTQSTRSNLLSSSRTPSRCARLPPAAVSTTHPCSRNFHSSRPLRKDDREKVPEAPPPTNFSSLDVLGNTPAPSTSVEVCMYDGFGLNSGIRIGDGNGALLVNGEAFEWRPWETMGKMEIVNAKGQFEVPKEAFAIFEVLWPRPDMLVIGTGKHIRPISPSVKQYLASLGMRAEAIDTRNAAAQFNLLATERGVSEIAGALIPIGWQEGVGAK